MSRTPTTTTDHPNAADQAHAGAEPWREAFGRFVLWFFASALITIGANLALRGFPSLHIALRALLVAVSIPTLVAMIVSGLRVLGRMDELERRIQLEALACAFGVVALLLVVYGQAQTAFRLTPEPWTIVWPMMYGIYAACLLVVRRRYQ